MKSQKDKIIFLEDIKEEYISFPDELKGVHLIEINLKGSKQPKQFKAINLITGEIIVSDNQKQFSKEYGLKQANVSHAVLNNSYHGDWKFQLIQKIDIKDSSAYQNQINNLDGITIKNINTDEIKDFKTVQSMKDFLGLSGHDIKQYILNDNILMDEWKII